MLGQVLLTFGQCLSQTAGQVDDGRLSMPLNRWSNVAGCRVTVATISGCERPRIALIWPEVKSRIWPPSSVNTKLPAARSMIERVNAPALASGNGQQVVPSRDVRSQAMARIAMRIVPSGPGLEPIRAILACLPMTACETDEIPVHRAPARADQHAQTQSDDVPVHLRRLVAVPDQQCQ